MDKMTTADMANSISVYWVDNNDTSALDSYKTGRLTTQHAASSRGLPVVVDIDGRALGPSEVGTLIVSMYEATDDEAGRDIYRDPESHELALIDAGRFAGYRIEVTRG